MMIFQKNKNERGQYISVLEYGAKNSKGSIVILEGKNRWEWKGIYQKIQSILASDSKGTMATTVVDIGRKTLVVMENNKLHESLSFKNVVINNVITPMTLGKERADFVERDNRNTPLVNDQELNERLVLKLGPNGKWEVKWVGFCRPSENNGVHYPRYKPKVFQRHCPVSGLSF